MKRPSPLISKDVQSEIDKYPSFEDSKLWCLGIHLACRITHADIVEEGDVRISKDVLAEIRDLLLEQKEG